MILAIGNSSTYEVEGFKAVFEELKKRGHESVLFKQDKCLESDHLTFELIAGKPQYGVVIDGKRYDTDSFSAIWYMHPHLPKELLMYEPVEHRQLINRQFDEMRRALWSVFRHKRWINDPWAVIMTENKIYQSYAAIQAGFHIPDTIVTSHPDEVRDFYETHERNIIVKLLATSPILGHVIFTNRIKPEDMAKIESVRYSPSIFQAYVPKAYELRITVVGEKFFSAKILSQADEETAIDWRKKPLLNDFQVKMERTELPQEIEKKTLLLMQNLGLRYGCVDMIVTPTDDYVFLEINPNGQWYFVQLRTEMDIAEALADLLT